MARSSVEKALIEAERLQLLHGEQKKLREKLNREIKVKKAGYHLPGETQLKKNLAVFFKIGIPGISFTEIAARIGEPKSVVKKWFKEDAEVKELYEWSLNNLKDGAIQLLKTYGFEAVETQVLLMRFGSEKYMFEASREILGMVGISKVSKQEIEAEHKKSHEWTDRNALVQEIRELPVELQEEAVEALEKFEELLASNSQSKEKSDMGPIMKDDEDEDEI